jgi:hypothetical protein
VTGNSVNPDSGVRVQRSTIKLPPNHQHISRPVNLCLELCLAAITSGQLSGSGPVNVSCSGSAMPTGTRSVALVASYGASGPCSGGTSSGNTTLIVQPAPAVSIIPQATGSFCVNQAVNTSFAVTASNLAGSISWSVSLDGTANSALCTPPGE